MYCMCCTPQLSPAQYCRRMLCCCCSHTSAVPCSVLLQGAVLLLLSHLSCPLLSIAVGCCGAAALTPQLSPAQYCCRMLWCCCSHTSAVPCSVLLQDAVVLLLSHLSCPLLSIAAGCCGAAALTPQLSPAQYCCRMLWCCCSHTSAVPCSVLLQDAVVLLLSHLSCPLLSIAAGRCAAAALTPQLSPAQYCCRMLWCCCSHTSAVPCSVLLQDAVVLLLSHLSCPLLSIAAGCCGAAALTPQLSPAQYCCRMLWCCCSHTSAVPCSVLLQGAVLLLLSQCN